MLYSSWVSNVIIVVVLHATCGRELFQKTLNIKFYQILNVANNCPKIHYVLILNDVIISFLNFKFAITFNLKSMAVLIVIMMHFIEGNKTQCCCDIR